VADFLSDEAHDESVPDQRPRTALMGFAAGGVLGMIQALADSEDDTEGGVVEDPVALRLAEEAVAHDPVDRPLGPHITGAWTTVATQVRADDYNGLLEVAAALESEGVDFGWDPYDPRDTPGFTLSGMVAVARKPYSIVVPESQAARARGAVPVVPPRGVTYAWAAGTVPRPTPVTGHVSRMSDNERLERMAAGGLPAGALVLVVVGGLVAIGAAALLLLR
jgi:hypothetical protein